MLSIVTVEVAVGNLVSDTVTIGDDAGENGLDHFDIGPVFFDLDKSK